MASKLLLLLILTATLGVSFWSFADPGSMPAGISAPDPNLPVVGPEFASAGESHHFVLVTALPSVPGGITKALVHPLLYPSRR